MGLDMDRVLGNVPLNEIYSNSDTEIRTRGQSVERNNCVEDAKTDRQYEAGMKAWVEPIQTKNQLIPRALLKKYLRDQRNAKIEQIHKLDQELRELDQFEKTFCSLSEPLQDALAPYYFRH